MRTNDIHPTSRVARAGVAGYLVVAVLTGGGAAPAFGLSPPECAFYDAGKSVHERLGESCCAGPGVSLSCSYPPADPPTSLNSIVVIIADDNSYCHWSFMGGLCAESTLEDCQPGSCDPGEVCSFGKCLRPCASNAGCTENDTCVSSDEFVRRHPGTEPPLRLNEPACRNRQARRGDANKCSLTPEGRQLENAAFKFNRENAPCERNDADDDPHLLTPFVDEIANRAAVFPRAHVSGNSCKPGRATFLFGRHNIHLGHLKNQVRTDPCAYPGVPAALDRFDITTACDPSTPDAYESYLFLKGEVANGGQAGFDGGDGGTNGPLGGITNGCAAGSVDCANELQAGRLPRQPVSPGVWKPAIEGLENQGGVFERLARDSTGVFVADATGVWQQKPFLVWFAPNSPHEGGRLAEHFKNLYHFEHPDANKFFGRVSQFDVAVGGVLDGLQRRCVCDTNGSSAVKRSLLDKTVVVFVTDNGFFLPQAKGKHHDNENTQRLPILISDPARRNGPTVWNNELANSADVLRTLQDLADGSCGNGSTFPNESYPFSENLCSWVREHTPPSDINAISTHPIRKLTYGHSSGDPFQADGNGSHYLITRAGLLGVCSGTLVEGHAQPCAAPEDCNSGTCHLPGDTGFFGSCPGDSKCLRDADCTTGTCSPPADKGGRCANRPDLACAIDADCAVGLCDGDGKCKSTAVGRFADFAPADDVAGGLPRKTCVVGGVPKPELCVPRGTCRPLVLKVKSKLQNGAVDPTIHQVFDLAWDPDEKANLLLRDTDPPPVEYLSASLKTKLQACLDRFYKCGSSPSGACGTVPECTLD